MGNSSGKNKKKINIPKNYELLKIVSYNVRLLFHSPLRAAKIGYYLVDNSIDNDVVCLQEINDIKSRETIIDIVKESYPNICVIPSEYDNVGLLLLSKYKVIDHKCIKFDEKNSEIVEYSGILCVNLEVCGNIVSIFNVQFQSDFKNIISNRRVRGQQMIQLIELLRDNMEDNKKLNFVIGSLNVLKKEYNEMVEQNNFYDIYKELNDEDNGESEVMMLKLVNDDRNIYRNYKLNFVKIYFDEEIDYSDRKPIVLFTMIKKK